MQKRQTRQKILVTKCFTENACFTADDIMSRTNLPKATVYRLLKQMVTAQSLHSFVCQGKTVYSNSSGNHSTFTCLECESTMHIQPNIKMDLDHKVQTINMNITGTCLDCLNKTI